MHFDRLKPYVGRELVGWESLELPVTPVQRRQEEPLVEEGVIGGVEENHEDGVVSATPGPMESVQENTETVEDQEEDQEETPPPMQGRRNPPRHRRRPQRYL